MADTGDSDITGDTDITGDSDITGETDALDDTPIDAPRPRAVAATWRRIVATSWAGALMALVAVAVSSRTVGKPPWWLGPGTSPAPVVFALVPVALVGAAFVATWWPARFATLIGVLCSLGLGAVALPDVSSSPGVATVQGAIALSMLMVSVAQRLAVGTVVRR